MLPRTKKRGPYKAQRAARGLKKEARRKRDARIKRKILEQVKILQTTVPRNAKRPKAIKGAAVHKKLAAHGASLSTTVRRVASLDLKGDEAFRPRMKNPNFGPNAHILLRDPSDKGRPRKGG